MGLKHCMGHIYTKKIYHCFIWNSDLSEHLVFLATKSGHIRASCIFSYEPRRLQWNAGWVCDVSRRHSPTWLPVGLRVSWAGFLTSLGAVSFWPDNTELSLRLLAKYCLASPAWDPREGSNGSHCPFLSKSRKGQPILSAIFYLLKEVSQSGSHPGEGATQGPF